MAEPVLQIRGLNVYYGASHALQGVDLTLERGVLSVVGRNGMGKSTLCKTVLGMVPASSGEIRLNGQALTGLAPQQIARLGVGYVPQGRRLWRSLTVDEHLRLVGGRGAWTIERVYGTFPRLAERKANGGGQLSGGEQQMLAIARALLMNPKLLVMDEPTEGLAPVIVSQLEAMLRQLAEDGEMSVLLIEQNIGVATEVAQDVAIMVNGRVNRVMDAAALAADRDLQQRLLGVGRHGHDDTGAPAATPETAVPERRQPKRLWISNPTPPTRWSNDVPVLRLHAMARTVTDLPAAEAVTAAAEPLAIRPLSAAGGAVVLIAGTLDTKGRELRFVRDLLRARGLRTTLVDLSTSGREAIADVPARQLALYHPQGPGAVFGNDRGRSVAAMATAFEAWMRRQNNVAGIIAAGGSGGTAMATPAMRVLPVGVPKVMVSTVASGQVERYVGPSDIMMLHSVADVQGLNRITREVLANAAEALAGMVAARRERPPLGDAKAAVGLTMFGVTTACVQQVTARLEKDFDCLVFHATGVGGRSMEKLIDSRLLQGVLDLTTTEICDMMMGGVFPANEDRFSAMIRARMPYLGACGALDMVNFGPPDTVPERYRGRLFYEHNPQVTLMRTTPDENRRMGAWIGERLNRMEAPVRFFLPEGGVSALDAPGMAFHDMAADAALFEALQATVRETNARRLIRLPHNINDPAFADAVVKEFESLNSGLLRQRRKRG